MVRLALRLGLGGGGMRILRRRLAGGAKHIEVGYLSTILKISSSNIAKGTLKQEESMMRVPHPERPWQHLSRSSSGASAYHEK